MAQAQVIAKVSSIHGEAFARDSSGKLRRLKVGDALRENESVVAADGSQVFLKLADGREMQVRPGETIKLDAEVGAMLKPDAADSAISNPPKSFAKIAKVVASGGKLDDVLEEPAAGNVAGGNEGHTFVELLRISETVDPQASFLLAGSGERNGSRGTGTEAPILGSETPITVFAPDNTNDNTPTITGQSALLPGGSITLTITDGAGLVQTVATTVRADGSFSVDVPTPLAEGNYSVLANGSDAAGNSGRGSDNGSVDTIPPALTAELDPASDSGAKGDGITNDTTPTIRGQGEPGARIEVVMPGTKEVLSTTVKADGSWSVTPGQNIPNGTHGPALVSETDSAGNISTRQVDLSIDNSPPAISINLDTTIAGDGIVNKSESTAAAIPVSGTVSGEFNVGDPVIVSVNGKDFATTVLAGGRFSVNVPGADLAADADRIIDARVSSSDAAGNTSTAQDAQNYTVSTTPPAIAISLDANVAGDGIVNKSESTATAIPVTGTVSGAFNVGDPVIVTVNGKEFATTVLAGGRFSVNVPGADLAADPDRIVDAKVSTVDAAGNTATALDTQNYTVNTTPPAIAISLDANVAGDGIVNRVESTSAAIPVTGTVSGVFNVGDPIIVSVNGKQFATTVLAGGRFSVDVPGADLAADPDRIVDAKVSTVDAAGNTATALDTQNYAVNTAPPAIAISLDANVAGDGIVNKSESTAAAIPVTGTVSGAFNVGDPVIVTVNGKEFATTVLAGGRFSVDVPGADLAADPDRIVDAKVSTVDAAGNTATALDTQNYTVNTTPPAIAISLDANVAGDGIVNKSESTAAAIPVTGTVSGAFNVGDPVIVTVNGKDFATTVLAGGRFSVNVPGADLAADADRIVDAKVSTVDAAGNTATALDTQNYTVNTNPPAIAISLDANIAGDGIVNSAESTAAAIPVTGTVSGAFNVGDPVIVTVNAKQFATTVLAGGRFSVDVPGADLAADADRIVDAKVTTTDAAGNTATASDTQDYRLATDLPKASIALDANFAGDGIINLAESTAAAIPVTGTVGGDVKLGDPIVVTVNNKDYLTTVIQRSPTTLGFSVNVAGNELTADQDHTIEAKVTTVDTAGNQISNNTSLTYSVDTTPPKPWIALDANFAGDGIINLAESTAPAIAVTGTVGGDAKLGDAVVVTVNNKDYLTTVIQRNPTTLGFSVDVAGQELAADADHTIDAKVTATDGAGNRATVDTSLTYSVDTTPPKPWIALDANFAGDGIINLAESTAPAIAVTGTVGGDAKLGDAVVVTVNGKDYLTTVIQRNPTTLGFSVNVAGQELAADADHTIDAKVTATDGAGNRATVDTSLTYSVDTTPPKPWIALDANFAGDGIINLAESTAPAIAVTGTVGGDAKLGDAVVVTVNNKDYLTTVIQRNPTTLGFSVDVAGQELAADADHTIDAKVTATDGAGNRATVDTSLTYSVDTTPPKPWIALDANFAGDGIINLAESTAPAIAVTGTVGGDAKLGDAVVVTVNAKDYLTTVIQRNPTTLGFSVNVAGQELAADADHTIDAKVTATDGAGNRATVDTSLTYSVDTTPPKPWIALDANFAGDGIINLAESTAPAIAVTGTVGGDAKLGDAVVVTVNGKDYLTTVIQRNPTTLGFTVNVAGQELAADADHTIDAKVTATDGAGNRATVDTSLTYSVDTTPPKPWIALDANFAGDGIINLAESTAPAIAVTGTVGGDAKLGDAVVVTVNGKDYLTTVIQRNPTTLGFSVDVAGQELVTDADHTIDAKVTATDQAGNRASDITSLTYALQTTLPKATIALDANFAGDGIINLAESTAPAIAVTGTVGGDVKLGDPVVVSINGKDYLTTVIQRNPTTLGFSVDVPGHELAADTDLTIDARVTATDQAGNQASDITSLTYTLDTAPPQPWIALDANFAGDGIINLAESTAPAIAVTGTVGGDAKLGDPVVVSINGTDYRTTVIQRNPTTLGFSVDVPGKELAADPDLTIEAKVTATDQAGNRATVETSLTYTLDTTPPHLIVDPAGASVSEEGLGGGNIDTQGTPDTTNLATTSGALTITDNSTTPLQLSLALPQETLTSGGVKIVWTLDASGQQLLGHLGSAGGETAISVKLSNDHGNYKYQVELLKPIDHPGLNGEDAISFHVGIQAADRAGNSSTAQLVINIEDDAPVVVSNTTIIAPPIDTNLLITLDVSDSMNEGSGVNNSHGHELTRFELAKQAISELLARYDAQGKVMVHLVTFSDNGSVVGDHWVDVATANAQLSALSSPGGATNYDAALTAARDAFADSGKLAGAQNVSYFFSDGVPTSSDSGALFNDGNRYDPTLGDGIDNSEEAAWKAFLNSNDVKSYAFGMGGDTTQTTLDPIAWNGISESQMDGQVITNLNQFAATVGGTAATPQNGSLGSFGADGGAVGKVEIGGYTYTYDAASNTITRTGTSSSVLSSSYDNATHTLTVNTARGEKIVVDMDDATYSYSAGTPLSKGQYTAVGYTLVDRDGDSASSTLRFMGSVDPLNVAPDTDIHTSGNLLGIIGLGALDLIDISTRQTFRAFDSNENLAKVEIKFTSFITIGTDSLAASSALAQELGLHLEIVNTPSFLGTESVLIVTSATPGGTISNLAINELLGTVYVEQSSFIDLTIGNSFSITATDSGGLSHTTDDFTLLDLNLLNDAPTGAAIIEGTAGNDTLTGSSGSDRLYGYAGHDTLQGGDGNDLLRGGRGNDTLDGGNGNDILISGYDNDILRGGTGSDVFRWEFADQGTAASPLIDRVMDFNIAPPASGGDVLDLRDLLQGEFHSGSDVGNLDAFLHFEKAGSNTVIDIRPSGSGGVSQQIVLLDTDLSNLGAFNSDALIIKNLLQNGKLITD